MTTKVYYDADGAILGRLGSVVCKELLKGKEVVVINSEKSIISGDRQRIVADISWWKNLGGRGLKGPKVSRMPHLLLKRMIRGMLPWDRKRGRDAYHRLRCYIGNGDLKKEELNQVKSVEVKKPIKYVTLAEVSREI